MNAKELLFIRRELLQMVAVLQPELKAEVGKMEEVQRKTDAAAKIIGTQEAADKKLAEAETVLKNSMRDAEEQIAGAKKANVEAQEKLVMIEAKLKDIAETRSAQAAEIAAHNAQAREHLAAHNAQLAAQAKRNGELDIRAEKLSALEERLRAKEAELDARMRRVREAAL